MKQCLRHVWAYRSTLVMILTPIISLPVLVLYEGKAGRCAYGIAIMAVFWCTEPIPMAVTSLLPILLFPWLGVMGSRELCKNYLKDTNFLFFAGLLIAVAVEKCDLHKRVALKVLCLVGSQPRWLMFGFMCTTAFLSMWLSNTATAAMLMPIANAVIEEMGQRRKLTLNDLSNNLQGQVNEALQTTEDCDEVKCPPSEYIEMTDVKSVRVSTENGDLSDPSQTHSQNNTSEQVTIQVTGSEVKDESQGEFAALSAGLLISIAFAANIGGTATLTGTGPNIVMKGIIDSMYPAAGELNYGSWFVFGTVNAVLCVLVTWFALQLIFLGIKSTFTIKRHEEPHEIAARKIILQAYKDLGPITFSEVVVLLLFTTQAILWFTREPVFIPGWGSLFFLTPGYVTDASVGVSVALFLFFIPCRRPRFPCFRQASPYDDPAESGPAQSILTWSDVHQKMAWNVIILLGGSFALADAVEVSGLSQDIGALLQGLGSVTPWVLAVILSFITGVVTNFTSNTATATIFIPLVAKLAESAHVNPLYLIIPVTVTASFAFVLPVATPPNAIVFAYGSTPVIEMVKSGLPVNILTVAVLQFSLNTYGSAIFGLGSYPSWALDNRVNTNDTDITTIGPI